MSAAARTIAGRHLWSGPLNSCCWCRCRGFFGAAGVCRLPRLYHPIFAAEDFERASMRSVRSLRRGARSELRAGSRPPHLRALGAERVAEVRGVRLEVRVIAVACLQWPLGAATTWPISRSACPTSCPTARKRIGRRCRRPDIVARDEPLGSPRAAGHDGAARTRPRAVRHLLRAMPQQARRRRRHDCPARLPAPALLLHRHLRNAPNHISMM